MAARRREDPTGEMPKAKLSRESLAQATVVFRYLQPYRWRFATALVTLFLSSGFALLFPYFAGSLFDVALGGLALAHGLLPAAPTGLSLQQVAALMFGALALQAMCSFYSALTFSSCGQRAVGDLRRDTYARMIGLPMGFFAQRRVGELSSRLAADLTQLEDTLVFTAPGFIRQSFILLGGITLIAVTSLKLTGIMLASLPLLIAVAVIFGRRIRSLSRETQDRLAESGTVVEETLQGIASVKAFSNERFEVTRYRGALDRWITAALRQARWRAGFISFIIFGLFSGIVIVLWAGTRLLQAGEVTVGELMRFILYTTFVAGAMGQFAELFSQVQKALGASQRVRELLREEPEIQSLAPAPAAAPVRLRGEVEFQDVRFRYPARPEVDVLKGLTLRAGAGQKIALVGPSGAGKSTIVSLLLRFYDPVGGRLVVDGRDAADYPREALRGQMSIVPQDVLLFGGTIAENIAYGRPGASAAEIEAAARQANAHDFIAGFPEGYATLVGERGVKLSGGQRQRVAIARAILKDPAILILDEATSSLDSESERLVQGALERLMEGRTTVMIAHRLATVRMVDRIYVIDGGRVVEAGTHAELEARAGGLYRRLLELQFAA